MERIYRLKELINCLVELVICLKELLSSLMKQFYCLLKLIIRLMEQMISSIKRMECILHLKKEWLSLNFNLNPGKFNQDASIHLSFSCQPSWHYLRFRYGQYR